MRIEFLIGGGVLVLGAISYGLDLPPFASPTFYEPGRQVYACGGGEGPPLPVTFSEDGRDAIVEAGDARIAMRFTQSWRAEVYRNGEWMLTLDPEANLWGPNGIRYSNCA